MKDAPSSCVHIYYKLSQHRPSDRDIRMAVRHGMLQYVRPTAHHDVPHRNLRKLDVEIPLNHACREVPGPGRIRAVHLMVPCHDCEDFTLLKADYNAPRRFASTMDLCERIKDKSNPMARS